MMKWDHGRVAINVFRLRLGSYQQRLSSAPATGMLQLWFRRVSVLSIRQTESEVVLTALLLSRHIARDCTKNATGGATEEAA